MKSELIDLIRKLSYEKREVTLASGQKSDFYIDLKQTLLNTRGIDLISTLISKKISEFDGILKGVGGLTMGADPLATSVSLKTLSWKNPVNAFYIRKEPKDHGTSQWVEGMKNFKKGDKVFILEDVMSTGKSSLLAVERAESEGLKVIGILTCVDRLMGGKEVVEKQGYPFLSLLTKDDIAG